jgi:hypothetical protein
MHIFACEEWIEFQKKNLRILKFNIKLHPILQSNLSLHWIDIWHFISYMSILSYLQIS